MSQLAYEVLILKHFRINFKLSVAVNASIKCQ